MPKKSKSSHGVVHSTVSKAVGTAKSKYHETVGTVTSNRPSLGIALLFSLLFGLFGFDRFYVGGSQTKYGALTLLGTLVLVGAPINAVIIMLTHISTVYSILTNQTTAFMYGKSQFQAPVMIDKVIAVIYIAAIIFGILFVGIGSIAASA